MTGKVDSVQKDLKMTTENSTEMLGKWEAYFG